MSRALELLRRAVLGPDARLARQTQQRDALRDAHEHRAFERELAAGERADWITLGRCQTRIGQFVWVGMPREEFLGRFWWWTGATGSGKSMSVLGVLLQLFASDSPPIVVVDAKGELSAWLRSHVFPWLATTGKGERLLQHLRIVRPFDQEFVTQLRVTAPEPGVPVAVQAVGLATSLAEAVGGDLGHRMHRVFTGLTAVAIERGEPLSRVVEWLRSPAAFARAARETTQPELLDYALRDFPTENRESVRALQARLGELLFVPQVRACLDAPACVSLTDCLERGVTLIDACDPPGGVERLKQLMESLVLGRLSRAILSRPIEAPSPQTLIVFEEFQESLRTREAENFGRLVAQARYKRMCLLFVNQQPQQIDPTLRRLLRTNCGGELAFRCSREDAEGLVHALPLDRSAKSATAARQAVIHELTRLPRRQCLLWLKDRSFGAQVIRSPRLELEALRSAAVELPAEVHERLRRGIVATPRVVGPVGPAPVASVPVPIKAEPVETGEFPGLG